MKFSAEWIDGPGDTAEERATLCEFRIHVQDSNVCEHYDAREQRHYESLVLPAVHVAEGIALDWWRIFGARDHAHGVLAWRTGYALPQLAFEFDGADFHADAQSLKLDNPNIEFLRSAVETASRSAAEESFEQFVGAVVERLAAEGVTRSDTELRWARVVESRADLGEQAFCEAAGALGADPYAIADDDAELVGQAGALFEGEPLNEFLAGLAGQNAPRQDVLDWITHAERRPRHQSRLPELAEVAADIARSQALDSPAWAQGYRTAHQFREALDLDGHANELGVSAIAHKLGARHFERKSGPNGVFALVSRSTDHVNIHLRHRGTARWATSAETFAFARAIGDAICFPSARRSAINDLHRAQRQATGRAFAAELLAPIDVVLEMREDGKDLDEIAGVLGVNPTVIERQLDNRDRIGQALVAA